MGRAGVSRPMGALLLFPFLLCSRFASSSSSRLLGYGYQRRAPRQPLQTRDGAVRPVTAYCCQLPCAPPFCASHAAVNIFVQKSAASSTPSKRLDQRQVGRHLSFQRSHVARMQLSPIRRAGHTLPRGGALPAERAVSRLQVSQLLAECADQFGPAFLLAPSISLLRFRPLSMHSSQGYTSLQSKQHFWTARVLDRTGARARHPASAA